jgi:phosphatidylethanolamine-binding protein (PEBP) family uncharacterized protein
VALLCVVGCGGGEDSAAQTQQGRQATTGVGDSPSANAGRAEEKDPWGPRASGGPPPDAKQAAQGRASAPEGRANPAKGQKHPPIKIPEGKPEPGLTARQKAQSTAADMILYSPDLPSGSTAPFVSTYTCDGKDSWPRFSWTGVPSESKELLLLGMNSQPVDEKLFFDWAVARIDPSLTGLEAGRLPKGAVMGRNSFGKDGYSICPPPGSRETYIFMLYALPKALAPAKGFEPLALREATLAISGHAGLMAVSYARG